MSACCFCGLSSPSRLRTPGRGECGFGLPALLLLPLVSSSLSFFAPSPVQECHACQHSGRILVSPQEQTPNGYTWIYLYSFKLKKYLFIFFMFFPPIPIFLKNIKYNNIYYIFFPQTIIKNTKRIIILILYFYIYNNFNNIINLINKLLSLN